MIVQYLPLTFEAKMPTKALDGSAGYDLWPLSEGVIEPMSMSKAIGLGFSTSFDPGYVAHIRNKSGPGFKGLMVLGGIIDADYRGEWFLKFFNASTQPFHYGPSKSIAQVLFHAVESPTFIAAASLPQSLRGDGKEGSTGA